jgi:hypothetical protein
VEAVDAPRDEADARVDGLDQGVGEACSGGEEGVEVTGDAVGDGDEGLQPTASGPLQPVLQSSTASSKRSWKMSPKCSLSRVGPVEALVDPLDPGQLAALPVGEVVGIAPERQWLRLRWRAWAGATSIPRVRPKATDPELLERCRQALTKARAARAVKWAGAQQ